MKEDRSFDERLLAFTTAAVLIGQGYGYVFWGSPLRVLAWDESVMSPFVALFGYDWSTYVTSPAIENILSGFAVTAGIGFVLLGLMALWSTARRGWPWLFLLGGGGLLAHALLDTKDHFFYLVQLLEHGLRVGTPLLLYMVLGGRRRLLPWLKVLTAVTFAAHGLYALSVYPVPARFVDMTQGILGVGEGPARTLLWWAGALDLVVAVLLFLPRTARIAFGYAAVWGGLTALARIVYGWDWTDVVGSLHAHLWRTVVRLPHALLPLLALLLLRARAQVPEHTDKGAVREGT